MTSLLSYPMATTWKKTDNDMIVVRYETSDSYVFGSIVRLDNPRMWKLQVGGVRTYHATLKSAKAAFDTPAEVRGER